MTHNSIDDVVVSQQVPASVQSQFSIESLDDRYRIHGVMYQGRVHTVDVSKTLLDNEESHRQGQWSQMTQQGEWKLASGSLYFAVMSALYDNREHSTQKPLVEEVRTMFADDFVRYFMMTSTRVCYAREGLDTVKHDVDYASECAEQANIVGLNGDLNQNSQFSEAMQALVGVEDCGRIQQVGKWISGKDSYLGRFNSKPSKSVERALMLGVNYDMFGIGADGGIYNGRRARGFVARVAENP
jgi:hypothetical protein